MYKFSAFISLSFVAASVLQAAVVSQNTSMSSIAEVEAVASASDLVNQGQATFGSSTVTANRGGTGPDGANDGGFNDGAVSHKKFDNMTWFQKQFDGVITLNLDDSANTKGYNIATIHSICGWDGGKQAEQTLTVEYSGVGDEAFVKLGTFSNGDMGAYSKLSLSDDSKPHLAAGVDALRFSYAANTAQKVVVQEIDVIGAPAK